jgi:hypothetical protein
MLTQILRRQYSPASELSALTLRVAMRSKSRLSIRGPEPLELRFTPASVFAYTDIDGDKVTLTATAGNLAGHATIVSGQLQLLDLSDPSFNGASLTVSVVKAGAGDGLAAVGRINAGTNNLGAVAIRGDLAVIDAGNDTAGTPAVKSLSVRTMGRYGLDTQGGTGDLESDIKGALGALTVTGDVKDVFINVGNTGSDPAAAIGPITVGGSLVGGDASFSGSIHSDGVMGAIKIGHDVQGGSGSFSGFIEARANGGGSRIGPITIGGSLVGGSGGFSAKIQSQGDVGVVKIGHNLLGGSGFQAGFLDSGGKVPGITVGGSVVGGSNLFSGFIQALGDLGAVKIVHDVQGGSGSNSGLIRAFGKIASVMIGGSLLGGSNLNTGEIISTGSTANMGAVRIGHDLTGGSITGSATLDRSGFILSDGRIASVFIGGSIISGIDDSTDVLTNNATIRAGNDIGSLTVKGSLVGHVTANGVSPVVISARGQEFPTPGVDLAIGKISIGGRVEWANILAGYKADLTAVNGDAQIGPVSVGGDLAASNLVAGAKNLGTDNAVGGTGAAADNVNFGDSHDRSIGPGNGSITASIASVTILGRVFGSPGSVSTTDHFGFVAQRIGLFKVGGIAAPLTAGPTNDVIELTPIAGDMTIREV